MREGLRPALPFLGAYVAIAGALYLLMRDHAFHPTDDGFILAYSWRIAHGEIPYRDFIFERTPLTPYLHAAWLALPEGWAIQAGRLAYYAEMVAIVAFPTLWATTRGLRLTMPALALTAGGFLIALHNFPPMPWTTVDGLFFASAGIAALLMWRDTRKPWWLVLATLALSLAVLAKQSFAPLLAVAVMYALVAGIRQRDPRVVASAALPPAVVFGTFAGSLAAVGALEPFLYQIAQPSQMRPTVTNPWSGDFVAIALKPYLVALAPGITPLLALTGAAFLGRDKVRGATLAWPVAAGTLVLAAVLMPTDSYNSGFVVFYAAAMVAFADVLRAARGRATAVPLVAYGLVLLAGWCSSLSFAYQTPVLAVGMLGPLVAPALSREATRFGDAIAAVTLAAIASVSLFANVELPYRDAPRAHRTEDLGQVYPRFGHLYTNAANAARHRELRDLSTRFALERDRPFSVFTSFPLAHFLSGTRNPLSVDWLQQQEYLGNDDRLAHELRARRPVMLVQRELDETIGAGPAPLSCAAAAARAPAFAAEVLARSTLDFEGRYFCVYTP